MKLPTKVEVKLNGEQVELVLGNTSVDLTYEQALMLGRWLTFRGGQAKTIAGDLTKSVNTIADLRSAEENYEVFVKPNNLYSGSGIGGS